MNVSKMCEKWNKDSELRKRKKEKGEREVDTVDLVDLVDKRKIDSQKTKLSQRPLLSTKSTLPTFHKQKKSDVAPCLAK